jgi:ferredoxin
MEKIIQVKINQKRCRSLGHCAVICPDIFEVIAGKTHVLKDPIPDEQQDYVLQAVNGCPSNAITIS